MPTNFKNACVRVNAMYNVWAIKSCVYLEGTGLPAGS